MFITGITKSKKSNSSIRNSSLSLFLTVGICVGLFQTNSAFNDSQADVSVVLQSQLNKTSESYIVSADDYQQLLQHIQKMGIKPSHELKIINAVALSLNNQQLAQLQQKLKVNISSNYQVKVAAGLAKGKRRWQPMSVVSEFINAKSVQSSGNYGAGVTIGFLDTGLTNLSGLSKDLNGKDKYWGTYDAINDIAANSDYEANGHGTHVASIAGNADFDINGKIYGVAPNALIVGIKAFDGQGKGSYADVIRGIEWAITNKDMINLKVLNLSFSGPAVTYYWKDPLNQAVMRAWQAGIVVVASAGNKGPDPMTIGAPGNIPYIITVGAMTDNYTPKDFSDDKLAKFSSAGPTMERFVKPEIIAPGGHMSGLMTTDTYIVTEHPEFHDGGRYFEMSGTSQATAVVSGVAALILTADPSLSPDQVKCRLMASARSAMKNDGTLGYSVFQQGAGVVDAAAAIASTASNCANQGLDIAKDISGETHYFGPANINDKGDLYVEGLNEQYVWSLPSSLTDDSGDTWRSAIETDGGFVWHVSSTTNNGAIWSSAGYTSSTASTQQTDFETDSATIWSSKLEVNGGFVWHVDYTPLTGLGINHWVDAY